MLTGKTLGFALGKSVLRFSCPMKQNAAERVRARIKEWTDIHGHGSQRRLARAVPGKYGEPRSDQWLSDIINDRQDLALSDLDAVAEAMNLPPGDLVRRNHDHYMELIPSEMRFVMYLRTLPDTIRHNMLHVWEYFFAIQERLLKEQKNTVDKRTKAARLQREHMKLEHAHTTAPLVRKSR